MYKAGPNLLTGDTDDDDDTAGGDDAGFDAVGAEVAAELTGATGVVVGSAAIELGSVMAGVAVGTVPGVVLSIATTAGGGDGIPELIVSIRQQRQGSRRAPHTNAGFIADELVHPGLELW